MTATDEHGPASEFSMASQPVASQGAPVNSGAPAISGATLVGNTLAVTSGNWSAEGSLNYAYQWERCDEAGECSVIDGAIGSSYTLTETDAGSALRVLVSATYAGNTSTGLAAPTAAIGPEAIAKYARPSISGVVEVDGTLSAEAGIWSGVGRLSDAYQWERCKEGSECTPITGADESSYLIAGEDRGSSLRVKVTVSGPFGSQSALSAATVVTPGGEASATEAQEAAEKTDASLLATSTTATLEGQDISPGLGDGPEEIASHDTLTSATVSKENAGEFAVNTPVGALALTPLASSSHATTVPTIVNGAAAVFANTWPATDTVVRAEPLGVATVLQLRSPEAPTSFSWELHLGPDQRLEQLPGGSVAVTEAPEEPEEEHESSGPQPSTSEPGEGQEDTSAENENAEREERESSEVEAKGETETEVPLPALPAAPLSSTPPSEPISGQPKPQDSQASYEAASGAMVSAEAQTGDKTLIVIQAPAVTDSSAHNVPAAFAISGDTVTLTVKPQPGASFPMIADVALAAPSDKVSTERDAVKYGLSDVNASTFESFDSNLEAGPLKVHRARLVIPFDTFPYHTAPTSKQKEEQTRLANWLAAVKAHHLQPYVTVGRDEALSTGCERANRKEQTKGKPCIVPKLLRYRQDLEELARHARGVTTWGAWNEPDYTPGPLQKHPELAAALWRIARSVFPKHDTVVAGEFAFVGGFHLHYVTTYRKMILKYHPHVWGFHDYDDVIRYYDNEKGTRVGHSTRAVANAVVADTGGRKGDEQLWISEAGVQLEGGVKTKQMEGSEQHQKVEQEKAATEFLALQRAAPLRIQRVYYYSYGAPTESEQEKGEAETNEVEFKLPFDSGLVEGEPEEEWKGKSEGAPRPAYCIIVLGGKCPPAVGVTTVAGGNEGEACHSSSECLFAIGGMVNPEGSPTTYHFEYGPTAAYGHTTRPKRAGSGDAETQVTENANTASEVQKGVISGVLHYRIIVHNAHGITKGGDGTVNWGIVGSG